MSAHIWLVLLPALGFLDGALMPHKRMYKGLPDLTDWRWWFGMGLWVLIAVGISTVSRNLL